MKSVSSNLLNQFKSLKIENNQPMNFSGIQPAELATSNSLVFISSKQMLETALTQGARGFIILEKIYADLAPLLQNSMWSASTPNIHWAMSDVLTIFDVNKILTPATIHPTAVISSTAHVGKNVSIAPYVVIEDHAYIEDNALIGSHTVIEHHAKIGQYTQLSPHVTIGSHCSIGKNCRIASHVVIGSDGFGFFTDKTFTHHKIAQIGNVVIEDNVELGAHCAIDRATLTETRIKSGSKFDNHCHIAHNCVIGENAVVAAGFIVAGSTIIGKNLMSSGGVGVLGHLKVTDNVILTARAGVMNSIEKSGMYGGYPAIDHKENLKTMAAISNLTKMRKQLNAILKHLGLEI
jgi:UDP-3-O-[3-hydroxymyristoyl] glucosamine N-acyltransferase